MNRISQYTYRYFNLNKVAPLLNAFLVLPKCTEWNIRKMIAIHNREENIQKEK